MPIMVRTKRILLYVLLCVCFCMAGCEEVNLTEEEETVPVYSFVSMEDEAVLEYNVPRSSPHILVDQWGYNSSSSKLAYFFGEELPKEFQVRDAESDITVYVGKLDGETYSEDYKANISFGDFSELEKTGKYYIYAENLGSSYNFSVGEDMYKDLFTESCRTYYYNRCGITLTEKNAGPNAHNACHTGKSVLREDITVSMDVTGGWHQDATGSKNVENAAGTMAGMLLAYELFPDAFLDDSNIPESGNGIPDILDEIKYETDWLLKMQNKDTGAVYSAVTYPASDSKTPVSYVEMSTMNSNRAFAFILAKFSYVYKEFDRDYATLCLQAADRAWKYSQLLEKDEPEYDISWKMAAASELYRASGMADCKKFFDVYFSNPKNYSDMDMITFFGCATYLNTRQDVNTDYCSDVIKVIMRRAEDISTESRKSVFKVPMTMDQSNNNHLLEDMMIMTLVDYVISNHEYDTIIGNYLHYFLGQNPMSITYLDNVGTYNYMNVYEGLGLMKQFDSASKVVFMLSRIESDSGFLY